ncbi:MAG: UDP-3-O-(3-hydroxymyristoyl)glucosamine N-acyltransferase [Candidatus Eiseniibacteriota bacterium]|nr:MAG: UDP-3-O-(3-hydroxymyristoyl)glucosamine N-acyltransferase [Candidatus Eisenbacteria bacterium]
MRMRLDELAEILDGVVVGDGSVEITGVAGIREAQEGDITFLVNPKYESYAATTKASAVILANDHKRISKPIIQIDNPYLAFLKAVRLFKGDTQKVEVGTHPSAVIGKNVKVGRDVSIGPLVVIEDDVVLGDNVALMASCFVGPRCRIGKGTFVYPNVTLREDVVIGERVIIHSGAIIGSDGFGFAKDGEVYRKIPQVGNVEVGDDVEIGANVTIDRATTGTTLIGRGTKIDNLVQIGHNVVVGENSIIVAQVGISGSTEIGKGVTLAGQVGIVGHIKIGDYAMVGSQAGVTKSVPSRTRVSGYPAAPHEVSKRLHASLKRLPQLLKQFKELDKRVQGLEREKEDAEASKDD